MNIVRETLKSPETMRFLGFLLILELCKKIVARRRF